MIAIISFTLLELYTINEQAFLRTFLDIAWQPSPFFLVEACFDVFGQVSLCGPGNFHVSSTNTHLNFT